MSGRWWECPTGGERYALRLLAGCPRHRDQLEERRWLCPVDGAPFWPHQNICTQHDNARLIEVGEDWCPGGSSKPSKPTTGSGSSTSVPTGHSPAPTAASRSPRTRQGRAAGGSAASTATNGPATGGARSANPTAS